MINKSEFMRFYENHREDSSVELAFYADENNLLEMNMDCQCSNRILNEILATVQIGLAVDKNHFLFDLIEDTLQKIIPFGLVNHFIDLHKWILYRQDKDVSESEPKVLAIQDLSFGFVVWLISCIFAIAGFIYEISKFKGRRSIKELSGLIAILLFLRQHNK